MLANNILELSINQMAETVESRMIAWRRDIHAHPELANQESRTSKIVAGHLKSLGFDEVRTGLGGGTGVVGIIRGKIPGPTIGLRADMDALPVREETDLAFASKTQSDWGGKTVPVMHACGHDVHTSILMGAAEVFSKMRDNIAGTIMLIFQPAEEGPAEDWRGPHGAALLLQEGIFADPKPEALFALHVHQPTTPGSSGEIGYHIGEGGYAMSAFRLTITGRGGHAGRPWECIDPIVVAAQTIMALQTIPSRTVNATDNKVTISLGQVHAGDKFNVIPDAVALDGALRFTAMDSREPLERQIEQLVSGIAQSAGATASIDWWMRVPILYNDPHLTRLLAPSFVKATGDADRVVITPGFGLDDFSHFSAVIPSIFFRIDVSPDAGDPRKVGGLHSPIFWVNEDAMIVGLKGMLHLAFDYMNMHSAD